MDPRDHWKIDFSPHWLVECVTTVYTSVDLRRLENFNTSHLFRRGRRHRKRISIIFKEPSKGQQGNVDGLRKTKVGKGIRLCSINNPLIITVWTVIHINSKAPEKPVLSTNLETTKHQHNIVSDLLRFTVT